MHTMCSCIFDAQDVGWHGSLRVSWVQATIVFPFNKKNEAHKCCKLFAAQRPLSSSSISLSESTSECNKRGNQALIHNSAQWWQCYFVCLMKSPFLTTQLELLEAWKHKKNLQSRRTLASNIHIEVLLYVAHNLLCCLFCTSMCKLFLMNLQMWLVFNHPEYFHQSVYYQR